MLYTYPYKEIGPGILEINEYDCASMFLIIGSRRALLIDTGIGLGDLPAFLKTLTDLPIDVLLTHNHRDHVGNAPAFPRVYISAVDRRMGPMLRPLTALESRLQYAHHIRASHSQTQYSWTDNDMASFDQEPETVLIDDGFSLDLGGRQMQCVLTPGHTPGSMSVLDKESGYLFCGDACNGTVGLGVRPIDGMRHASMEEAMEALKRLSAMDFNHRQLYNGHADFRGFGKPLPENTLQQVIYSMEQVIAGQYTPSYKHIPSIHADVEIVTQYGIELQFHSENIYREHLRSSTTDAATPVQ
ncbi:MAG: MBL fold metallo-hydrolase [Clostridia bacterium]|nr:MBL fold metallo-hydrolase [Clostridia bacterium]